MSTNSFVITDRAMNIRTILTLLALMLLLCFSKAMAQQPPTDHNNILEKRVTPGSKVLISKHTGSLAITGWAEDRLVVEAGNPNDQALISIKEEGTTFTVTVIDSRHHRPVDLTVKVPKSVNLDVVARGQGNMSLEDVEGATSLDISEGDLTVQNVGTLTLVMSSGDVHIEQVESANLKVKQGDMSLEDVKGAVSVDIGVGDLMVQNAGALTLVMGSGDVHIEQVESANLKVKQGDISLERAQGSVQINSFRSDVSVKEVEGDVSCKSIDGDISISQIQGRVSISTANSEVQLSNIGNDLQISALNGDVQAECIKGHVDISNANGSITLTNIADDIQAVTVSGDISFAGAIHSKCRYTLKTTSGDINVKLPSDSLGFTANMSAYSGDIDTDIMLKTIKDEIKGEPNGRNIIGSYGDGQIQIRLDTFSGTVNLTKGYTDTECK